MALSVTDIIELRQRLASGSDSIAHEVNQERAGSLGHQGRMVEVAMTALNGFDAATGTAEERQALVKAAAKAVWAYFVVREACGLRNHRDAIQHYRIPGEVLARLGAGDK